MTPEGRTSIGYLHANCGGCHNPLGTAKDSGLFMRYELGAQSEADAPIYKTAVNIGPLPNGPGQGHRRRMLRIQSGNPWNSMLLFRMQVSSPFRMPPTGRKTADQDAVAIIEKWILELPH
jgi:hypothetical protein